MGLDGCLLFAEYGEVQYRQAARGGDGGIFDKSSAFHR